MQYSFRISGNWAYVNNQVRSIHFIIIIIIIWLSLGYCIKSKYETNKQIKFRFSKTLHVFFLKGCVYLIRKDSKIDSKTTSIFSGFQNSYEYLFDFY